MLVSSVVRLRFGTHPTRRELVQEARRIAADRDVDWPPRMVIEAVLRSAAGETHAARGLDGEAVLAATGLIIRAELKTLGRDGDGIVSARNRVIRLSRLRCALDQESHG